MNNTKLRPVLTTEEARQAARWLFENVDLSTVIDPDWFEHFYTDSRPLMALMNLTGLNSYEDILNEYEGSMIVEMIEDYEHQAGEIVRMKSYDVGWTIEIDGVETVEGLDFHDAAAALEFDISNNLEQYMEGEIRNIRTYEY